MAKPHTEQLVELAIASLKASSNGFNSEIAHNCLKLLEQAVRATRHDRNEADKLYKVSIDHYAALLDGIAPISSGWKKWAEAIAAEEFGLYNRSHAVRAIQKLANDQQAKERLKRK